MRNIKTMKKKSLVYTCELSRISVEEAFRAYKEMRDVCDRCVDVERKEGKE